jgi:hypothetical protein
MKKINLILITLALNHTLVFSQGCLPEGITFTTQEQINNFQTNYPGCTEIDGDVEIGGANISNLNGLNLVTAIYGNVTFKNNDSLMNLTGLSSLTSIGGTLQFIMNNALINLFGIETLTTIGGDLKFGWNPNLSSLIGLEGLTAIGGELWINSNNVLNSLTGLNNLTNIGSTLDIEQNEVLINLTGLEGVTSLEGPAVFVSNSSLTNLVGLDNVISIGGELLIYWNPSLTSLAGLGNVTNIGGNVTIGFWFWGNPALTDLTGLESLTSIGGNLEISHNDILISLVGLDNVTSIAGKLEIESNPVLNNLIGLNNIEAGSISNLSIKNNNLLFECDIENICDYLAIPSVLIVIENNSTGCNSADEVQQHCLTTVIENISKEAITLFPNPATSYITINIKEGIAIEEAIIYNHLGQKALAAKPLNNTVDVSMLKPGIYFIEVAAREWRGRTKMVKK